jgi:hypothetical protein
MTGKEKPRGTVIEFPVPDTMRALLSNKPDGAETIIKDGGYCMHAQIVVDEKARGLFCNLCNATLDPFEQFKRYANQEAQYRVWDRELARQRKQLSEMKDEETKIRARTRNASRKDAELAVAEERKRSKDRRDRSVWNAREMKILADKIINALSDERPRARELMNGETR